MCGGLVGRDKVGWWRFLGRFFCCSYGLVRRRGHCRLIVFAAAVVTYSVVVVVVVVRQGDPSPVVDPL